MIATVTTLRTSLAETLRFVRYHRNIGVDRMFLIFDDPADPAIEALRDTPGVTAIPSDAEHRRRVGIGADPSFEERLMANALHGFRLARDGGFAWSVHIDSDELIHAPGGLARALSEAPASAKAVRLAVLEAVPEGIAFEGSAFTSTETFRVPARGWRARAGRALTGGRPFFAGEYLRGYTAGKSAIRTSADVVEVHSHNPILASGRVNPARVPGLNVLHFDCTSLDGFRAKWSRRVDGTARGERMRPARVAQLDAYRARVGDDRAIEALYRRLYLISGRDRAVLRALGMLTTVRVDRGLLESDQTVERAA